MRLKFTRFLIRFLLRLLTHIEVHGRENVPATDGNFVIASNHLGLVDAFLPFYILDHNNLVLLVGEKWEKVAIMRWLGRRLNFIFVDRFNPDLKAIRAGHHPHEAGRGAGHHARGDALEGRAPDRGQTGGQLPGGQNGLSDPAGRDHRLI